MSRRFVLSLILACFGATACFFAMFADFHTRGEAREALFISSVCENNGLIPQGYDEQLPRKPPFYYWVGCLFFKIIGKSEFAARLPSILASVFFLAIFYLTLRRFKSALFSLVSLFILATSPAFFSLAEVARLDMLHYATMFGGWFLLLLINNFFLSVAVSAILISVSALTKGPVSIVLTALVLGFFLTFKFEKRLLLKVLLSLVCSTIISGSFYFYFIKLGGPSILNILLEENIGRFYGNQTPVPHANSLIKIWFLLFLGLGIWSYLVCLAVKDNLKAVSLTPNIKNLKTKLLSLISRLNITAQKASREEFLLFSSFLIPFCFFSISEGKRLAYFLICYPYLAYLLGLRLVALNYGRVSFFISLIKFLNILFAILVFLVFVIAESGWAPQLSVDNLAVKVLLLVSGGANLYLAFTLSRVKQNVFLRNLWKPIAVALVVLFFSVNSVGGVYWSKVLSHEKLYQWVNQVNVKNLPVYSGHYEFYGLKFYGLPISSYRLYYKRPFLILTMDKNVDQLRRYFGGSQELYSRYQDWVDKPFNTPVLLLVK